MSLEYARVPDAVWRRVGQRCIVRVEDLEFTLEGGSAALWLELASARSREVLAELVDAGGAGPTDDQLDDALAGLVGSGLIVAR